MYNQSQRFLSTLLLLSTLLQSCHNAKFRLACEEVPKVPASQQGANTLLATPVQQTLVPIHAAAIEKISGNPTEGGHATPVASPTIIASYHAQDVGSAAGAPAASRTTSVKHAYTFEPSPKVQEAAQHPTHKSAHRVLDNTLLVQYTHRKEMPGTAISAPVWSSAHVVQLALPSQEAENSSQTEEKSSTHHMVRWASSPAALSSSSARPYLSAQGHQVRFERQAGGAWLAQVQDVWGRVQRLPVICAPDQTPEQAIQLLADKDPAQCKYWVHVLETDQLPGAPRFVYVGVLGIRGGGNSSSHDHGSSGRSNRESRRDRDDFLNDNRHTGVTLGTVGIGPQGPEMRFGPRNHHAESMAANNALNEAMRSASETRRSSTNTSTSGPSLGSYTSTFPRSSLDIPTLPRSGLNINTSSRPPTAYETMRRISSHSSRSSSDVPRWMIDSVLRSCDNDIADSGPTSQFSGSTSTPFSTSYTRQHSTDTGTRFANRNTDRQDYSATDHQEKTQSQESDNRPRQGEQQHARAERRDYEDFCGGEAPAPPTTNSASGQQRAKAPQRRWSPSDLAFQADISKNAYFLWKEQEEIRISKEAEKHAKQIYFSQWQKQEERRRQEASLREQEERRARLDETYRREERRRQEASLREQEDRRARLDETYRQDERRRQEAEAHTMASSAAPVPSASPTATTAPNTQQQRSGAVVSPGLVLDGEGKLKPHEVRVPFAAPRAYQVFPEASLSTPVLPGSSLNRHTSLRSSTADETIRTSLLSPQSSSEVPRWMIDGLHRSIADSGSTSQLSGSIYTPFSTSDTRQRSTDIGNQFANRNTDRQDYSATDHQEKTQSQEADNRPRQGEQQHQEKNTSEKEEATQLLKEFGRGLEVLEREAQEKLAKAVGDIEHAFEKERREKEEATREAKEKLIEALSNIEHAFGEEFRRQAEVSSATTAPNTQQQRSGAVVSQGLVLDGEGKLKPHEVRVPFAAPRAYQAFSEARAATAVQDARSADTVKKTTETQTALQQSVAAYQQSCEVDAGFQQQRSALSQLRERLKSEVSNEGLVRQYQEQEAEFQQHPLYQQGCDLAKEAQKLREAESAKADDIIMGSSTRMKLGVERAKLRESGQHRQAATGIRDDLLQPVREILKRPSTPPRLQSVSRFAKGVGESAVDTAKGIVSLPVVAVKCLGGAVHSLSTWEDKLGIGEKITDASELVKAFCEERKYEWENPEEYQSRFQAAQRYRNELNIAEKALNAEAYHKKDAQILGYWSGEALQAVFGAEIIKGGVGLVKGTQKAAKASKKVVQSSEAAKAIKTSQKVAQGTEAAQGVARAAKVEQGVGIVSAVQRAEKEAARAV